MSCKRNRKRPAKFTDICTESASKALRSKTSSAVQSDLTDVNRESAEQDALQLNKKTDVLKVNRPTAPKTSKRPSMSATNDSKLQSSADKQSHSLTAGQLQTLNTIDAMQPSTTRKQETLTAIDTSQQWSAINEQWSAEEQHVLLPAFDCDSHYSENVFDDISLQLQLQLQLAI